MTGYTENLQEAIRVRKTTVLTLEQKEIENLIGLARKLFPEDVERLMSKLEVYIRRQKRRAKNQ